MNKKILLVFLLMAVLIISGLDSCLSYKDDGHSPRIALDWNGVYTGTIPSASGIGIDVRLSLNRDQSFALSYEYLDKPNSTYSWTGTFQWDEKGYNITLNVNDVPPHYQVGQNKLIQLDMKGKPIRGSLADNYVLKKVL
jgi:uncharacterized lipoprotein NlpE involved in copper resistance